MKKTSLILTLSLFLISVIGFQANAQQKAKADNVSKTSVIQHKKNKEKNEKTRRLTYRYTGELNEQDLESSSYTKRWFTPSYDRYTPDEESMKTIKRKMKKYDIVVFMGTWCPDSHREIPRFYKILDEANYNKDNLKIYALAHGMTSKEKVEEGYNVHRVPTIIFYKRGKEVGRFVEHARESLAKDIAKIVSKKDYVNYLDNLEAKKEARKAKKATKN